MDINKKFQESLERVVDEHLVGNTTKRRWELRPKKQAVLLKLRLVLSWVMGNRALKFTGKEVLYHIIEHYKRLNHDGFMEKKYGEYYLFSDRNSE